MSKRPISLTRRMAASALALAAAGFFFATAILRPDWPVNGVLIGAGLVLILIFLALQVRKS